MTKMSRRDALGALGAAAAAATTGCAGVPSGAAPRRALSTFLLPDGYAFLNTGSLGACPRVVLQAVDDAWRRLERAPVYEGYGPLLDEADAVRVRAAAFLGADVDEVCITGSTTDGMNLVAEGVELRPGDHVLTTDHEHPGGMRCWEHAERHRGVVLDRVRLPIPPEDPGTIVQLLRDALTPDTRVVSVSHVTFTTGLRLPVRAIAEVVHAHGALFVVDGAQGAGALPVDVKALGCDAYATSGHKWMLGPKGTGLLYISTAARDRVHPIRLSDGPAVHTPSSGMTHLPSVIGLGAALDFCEERGIDAIARRNLAVRDRLYQALSARDDVTVLSPGGGELAAPMVSISLREDVDVALLHRTLREKHRVSVKRISGAVFSGLRFATHVYNSDDDIDRLLTALDAELSS